MDEVEHETPDVVLTHAEAQEQGQVVRMQRDPEDVVPRPSRSNTSAPMQVDAEHPTPIVHNPLDDMETPGWMKDTQLLETNPKEYLRQVIGIDENSEDDESSIENDNDSNSRSRKRNHFILTECEVSRKRKSNRPISSKSKSKASCRICTISPATHDKLSTPKSFELSPATKTCIQHMPFSPMSVDPEWMSPGTSAVIHSKSFDPTSPMRVDPEWMSPGTAAVINSDAFHPNSFRSTPSPPPLPPLIILVPTPTNYFAPAPTPDGFYALSPETPSYNVKRRIHLGSDSE